MFPELAGRTVHTTFLDRLPGVLRGYQHLLPIVTFAYEQLDMSDYDLVVSSSHAGAKSVLTRPDAFHLCYCHTPMRFAWQPNFLRHEPLGAVKRALLAILLSNMRTRDFAAAARVDRFVANSAHVAARIRKFYRRDAVVVHPPVHIEPMLAHPRRPDDHYLVLSRLVPYKRVDLAVQACTQIGRPLVVVGEGRDRERLEALAGPSVSFTGFVDEAEVVEQLATCRALLFPGEEDFGMVPVEAQAAGAPVVAFGKGGARETVVDGATGIFFHEPTPASLAEAMIRFERLTFDSDACRRQAARFAPERFDRELHEAIALGPERMAASRLTASIT
jgi:glycosyltransferase involved in cell wall biosynthesis